MSTQKLHSKQRNSVQVVFINTAHTHSYIATFHHVYEQYYISFKTHTKSKVEQISSNEQKPQMPLVLLHSLQHQLTHRQTFQTFISLQTLYTSSQETEEMRQTEKGTRKRLVQLHPCLGIQEIFQQNMVLTCSVRWHSYAITNQCFLVFEHVPRNLRDSSDGNWNSTQTIIYVFCQKTIRKEMRKTLHCKIIFLHQEIIRACLYKYIFETIKQFIRF